ncbi:MAG: peptidylprolyl isomerase [Nitrospinota bacterium]
MKRKPSNALRVLMVLAALAAFLNSALACSGESDDDPNQAESLERAEQEEAPSILQPQAGSQMESVDPASFPEVVARVNEEPIHKSDLLDRVKGLQARTRGATDNTSAAFYRRVLDELVGAELLYQASVARNLIPADAEVEAQIEAIQGRFPGAGEFEQSLSTQGLTLTKLRAVINKEMSIQKLIEAEIAGRVTVSEEAKKKFYEENRELMKQPEKLRLSHILVRVAEDAPPEVREEAKKKAGDLRGRVEQGEDFGALARQYSDDPGSKANGGELIITRGQTVPPFEQAALALEPEELSDVVETRFGYHIIKLSERIPSGVAPYQEVEGQIGEFLGQRGLQEQVEAEIEVLRSQAQVQIFI